MTGWSWARHGIHSIGLPSARLPPLSGSATLDPGLGAMELVQEPILPG
jgi:hypothetical protein